jgi:SAM-dependent methyltransferase
LDYFQTAGRVFFPQDEQWKEDIAMHGSLEDIRPHHRDAARLWGLGGPHYDDVSFCISDAIGHAVQRLSAGPGDAVLDIATGTGWTARTVARSGADVTAVDISEDLLAAARQLAGETGGRIEFRQADAECLPFANGEFDRVVSTFGVMFALDQERAAAEMARICKPGGRLVLATWVPGGSVAKFFAMIGKHSGAPAPQSSPLDWGDPAAVTALLGDAFDLTFEHGTSHAYHDDLKHIWDWYCRGFGPVRAVTEALDEKGREAFRRDFDDFHRPYLTEAGLLNVNRDYMVVIGRRR